MNSNSINIELAKSCLSRISNIAARGARSEDPANIGYALEELTQALFERTGNDERVFAPLPANRLFDLDHLLSELELIDAFSRYDDAEPSMELSGGHRRLRLREAVSMNAPVKLLSGAAIPFLGQRSLDRFAVCAA